MPSFQLALDSVVLFFLGEVRVRRKMTHLIWSLGLLRDLHGGVHAQANQQPELAHISVDV